jgi:hypothetical protein
MPFEIKKTKGGNYILYKISGVNSLQNLIELADEMHDDSMDTHFQNFILDCQDIHGSLEMGQLFEVGSYFAKTLIACKLAAINTPPEWRNNQFSENVIHNRGGQLEHFQSLKDAEQWLSKI